MRPSFLVGLALLLGAFTAYLAAQWLDFGRDKPKTAQLRLVVADLPIEAGTVVAPSQIRTVDWHAPELPAQALQDAKSAVGRVARYPLQPGEPVLESKLAGADAKAGLSAVITPGKRAISVRVNEVIGVAGYAMPGNFVDVLVSGKDDSQSPFSRVVISRAKVLAVGQDTNVDPGKPKVSNAVTLELSPAEAERLDLARTIGTLSLVLRNESDPAVWPSSGARMQDILGAVPAAARPDPLQASGLGQRAVNAAKTAQSIRTTVQEIRGTDRNEVRP